MWVEAEKDSRQESKRCLPPETWRRKLRNALLNSLKGWVSCVWKINLYCGTKWNIILIKESCGTNSCDNRMSKPFSCSLFLPPLRNREFYLAKPFELKWVILFPVSACQSMKGRLRGGKCPCFIHSHRAISSLGNPRTRPGGTVLWCANGFCNQSASRGSLKMQLRR